jgi:hypothetical protein
MTKHKILNGKQVELTAEEISQIEEFNTIGLAEFENIKKIKETEEIKKKSGKQKLLDLGLTEEEVKALIGV